MKLASLTVLLSLMFAQLGKAQTITVKDKSGKTVGYIKKDKKGNQTFYNKSHNKEGSSRKVNKTTTYYDKSGNKIYTFREKVK